MSRRLPSVAIVLGVLALGGLLSFLWADYAFRMNGTYGFPLDDPWIHLQFARNLHDYGSFSYYKDEMTTSGSTSPLYTFILALGFFVASNEMVLSYVLGVLFLVVAAVYMYRAVAFVYPPRETFPILPLGATILLLAEMRMQWAALSGMETTLFICLLLAVFYYYKIEKPVPLGISSGLLLWTRPEAVIMFIALTLDVVYHGLWASTQRAASKQKSKKAAQQPSLQWLKPALIVIGVFAFAYFAFNLSLSGSVFPNTFSAKLKYYGAGVRTGFPAQVWHFLTDGHMLPVAILAGVGLISTIASVVRREPQSQLVPLLFSAGMFLAYWMKLPYLYQEGRYLMPILPFVLLLGGEGIHVTVQRIRNLFGSRARQGIPALQAVLLLAMAAQFVHASWEKRRDYAEMCRYIHQRQVRTAHWLREHTPPNAVIGTHDIGAIAYYSGRRVADMVGLVSPEMIERIGSLERLHHFLVEKKVTHLAVLRNWFEVVNQPPLFKTNEREPEIMEVFAFDPRRTHLTSQEVTRAVVAAGQYLYQGQASIAEQILVRALQIDPQNSKVYYLLGMTHLALGRLEEASRELAAALRLYPEFVEAGVGLAQLATRQNRTDEALSLLQQLAREHPRTPAVFRALAEVYRHGKGDTVQARIHMQRFAELVQQESQN